MTWKAKFLDLQFPLNLNASSPQQALAMKFENRPVSLFKFRKVTRRSLQNLREGAVWLADPSTLNDPYDCSCSLSEEKMANALLLRTESISSELFPALIFSKTDVEAVRKSNSPYSTYQNLLYRNSQGHGEAIVAGELKDMFAKLFSEQVARLSAKRKEKLNLCSFSETLHYLPMWSHYADEHRGFCIEYDLADISARDDIFEDLYPVQYTTELFDASSHVVKGANDQTRNPWFLFRAALTKSLDWAPEREWRLVVGDGATKGGQSRNIWRPRKVHLGARVRQQNAQQIANICKAANIEWGKVELSVANYQLISTR